MTRVGRVERLEEAVTRLPELPSVDEAIRELAELLSSIIEEEFQRTFGRAPSDEEMLRACEFMVDNFYCITDHDEFGKLVAEAVWSAG